MTCGIGLFAGCLLMLPFIALAHARAVRTTRQQIAATRPASVDEIRADKDRMRAQFAVSVRRLEIGMEELRDKAASHYGIVDRHNAAMNRLQVELDRKTTMIFALRARAEVRKNAARRILKILLYLYVRARRAQRTRPPLPAPSQIPQREWNTLAQPEQRKVIAAAAAIAARNIINRPERAREF
jgi:hypothetical protein